MLVKEKADKATELDDEKRLHAREVKALRVS